MDKFNLVISAMTYNIYHNFPSSRNLEHVLQSIASENTDIFGCNEANAKWMGLLTAKFKGDYTCVKGENHKGDDTGDYCPIFFKTDKFDLIESGSRWLSDTPDVVSKFDESHTPRNFTYAVLADKRTGIRFMYIQAHLENNQAGFDSTTARIKQSRVLRSFLDVYASFPIIVGGDCNTTRITDLSPLLDQKLGLANASDVAAEKKESGTWVGGSFQAISGGVLDYFFVTVRNVSVLRYEAVDNMIDGKYPSDHIPVRIDAIIAK